MTAPGASPDPDETAAVLPGAMEVERVRLDDGRALLLFTWDDEE